MKQLSLKPLLTFLLIFCTVTLFAQEKNPQVDAFLKEGIALHDAKKFDEAILKYDEALKIEPENLVANFEKGYSLVAGGKADAALPYLEKAAASNKIATAYDVLGTIYDQKNNFDKAVSYYKQGISNFPNYPMLRYNLSICYLRQGKFAESEASATEAIKLNPRHPGSHQVYAVAMLNQNDMASALLGFCSFLLLEPQTMRSAEAVKFVRMILKNGIKAGEKNTSLSMADASTPHFAMRLAVVAATTDKKDLSPVDSLQLQLQSVFQILPGQKDKVKSPLFAKYLSDYFNNMAISANMPTFAHFITMTTNREEDGVWLKSHPDEIKNFTSWLNTTKREF